MSQHSPRKNTKQNDQISCVLCLREEGILAISPATNERTKRISSPPTSSPSEGKKKWGARDGDDGPIRAKKGAGGTPLSLSVAVLRLTSLRLEASPVGRRRKEGSRNGGSSLSLPPLGSTTMVLLPHYYYAPFSFSLLLPLHSFRSLSLSVFHPQFGRGRRRRERERESAGRGFFSSLGLNRRSYARVEQH